MNLLVTLNEAYLPPLRVMLFSLFENSSTAVRVYLLHTDISQGALSSLARFVSHFGHTLHPIRVDAALFGSAPVNAYYSLEMYYRLLAPWLLPPDVERVLYLDPDILILNPADALYALPMEGNLYAAAAHKLPMLGYINRLRLGSDTASYFNSGVLLIDLPALRAQSSPEAVFEYIRLHEDELLLPDQDVLNGLYGGRILALDEVLYNFDARRVAAYRLASKGRVTPDYIIENTVVLHFCGRQKPWKPDYTYRFGLLYKHRQRRAEQVSDTM